MPRVPRPRALLIAVVVLAALTAGWLGVRDLELTRVERVTITGATGPDAAQVRAALTQAAKRMTTLHVDGDALEDAVARHPQVAGLDVDRDLPHDLTISVREHRTVAAVEAGGRRTPLTADGRPLEGATAARDLPAVGGDEAVRPLLVRLVAAAPAPLRRRARRAYLGKHGVTVAMREGPSLYFGRSDRLPAKWAAASRVLAHPDSEGARYVDVRVPERAAAGGLVASIGASGSTPATDPPAQVEVQG